MSPRRRGWSGITVTDQFCGAGGSTVGAQRAGLEVTFAVNHWKRAVETYATNHPNTKVEKTNVSNSDPRRYPSSDVLITSPECTTHSPAGGNRRKRKGSDEAIDDSAFIRSRVTMWDVPRWAEYHEYRLIIAENVIEVTRWPLFATWLQAMHVLGYDHQLISLNSMFCHPTPQSRDRIYIVLWKRGNPRPDMEIRPKAPCWKCERIVDARQHWKNGRTVGKYRFQYVFKCVTCESIVTPLYYAALNAIDFTVPAERIGDRARPLKDRTIERIRYGLSKYGNRELIIRTNMTTGLETRVRGLEEPHFGQTASWLDGLFAPFLVNAQHSDGGPLARGVVDPVSTVAASNRPSLVSPFVIACANGGPPAPRVRGLDDALGSLHAGGNNYALISPSMLLHMHGDGMAERVRDPRTDPTPTQTARQDFGFVFNVAGREASGPLDRALPTQETREKFALLTPFLITERTHNKGNPLDGPLPGVCAGTIHHALIQGAAQISLRDADAMRIAGLDREFMTQGAAPQAAIMSRAPFLVSYYGNNQASAPDEPVDCVNTHDRHALVRPSVEIEDCYFRMLQPHEIGAAMAFPGDYIVTGNKREQVKQYGNAVTPPAMDLLVQRAVATIAPEIAA